MGRHREVQGKEFRGRDLGGGKEGGMTELECVKKGRGGGGGGG